jgi:hypothetical protein
MQADHTGASRRHPLSLLERRSSVEDGSFASPTSSSASTTTSSSPRRGPVASAAAMAAVAPLDSPHTVLTQTPLSAALHQYFAEDAEHASSFSEADANDAREELPQPPSTVNSGEPAAPLPLASNNREAKSSAEALVRDTCKTAEGRALFVKCLNRQRSLETKVKDQASFIALVACFSAFLDECVREDDIKAAKTAMILAETFYYPKTQQEDASTSNGDKGEADKPPRNGCTHSRDDEADDLRRRRASLCADCRDYTERTSEELLQYVDEAHPLLHGGGIGRGASRTYLQEEVKKHAIWKTPSVSACWSFVPCKATDVHCAVCCLELVLGESASAGYRRGAPADTAAVSMGRAAKRSAQARRYVSSCPPFCGEAAWNGQY